MHSFETYVTLKLLDCTFCGYQKLRLTKLADTLSPLYQNVSQIYQSNESVVNVRGELELSCYWDGRERKKQDLSTSFRFSVMFIHNQ